jgi:hypothetical protein
VVSDDAGRSIYLEFDEIGSEIGSAAVEIGSAAVMPVVQSVAKPTVVQSAVKPTIVAAGITLSWGLYQRLCRRMSHREPEKVCITLFCQELMRRRLS